MKHHIVGRHVVTCAGLLALGLADSAPAAAQGGMAAAGLPPQEVVKIVRATGIEPLSRPVRHGHNYMLHAVDPAGQPVRVTVDAKLGRIVAVAPDARPRFAAPVLPAPYARPPADIATVPDGYGPATRTSILPPGFETTNAVAPRERLPLGPGRVASATTVDRPAVRPTPLPRPRPTLATAEPAAGAPSAPPTPTPAASANAHKDAVQAKNVTPPAPVVEQHE